MTSRLAPSYLSAPLSGLHRPGVQHSVDRTGQGETAARLVCSRSRSRILIRLEVVEVLVSLCLSTCRCPVGRKARTKKVSGLWTMNPLSSVVLLFSFGLNSVGCVLVETRIPDPDTLPLSAKSVGVS